MTGIRRALPPALFAAAALACALAVGRALACPVYVPPQPLRTLYKLSERVVVARVGERKVLSTVEEVESVSIALHVTENVKGAPAELLHLHHDEYVGEDADETVGFSLSGRAAPRLKRGERYLFFLDPRAEGVGYEVNDGGYGIKQLSDEDLKVYLERLKELAELTREGPEDKHALAEWLVRCAEQPATRWEGAYELLQSAEAVAAGDTGEEAPAEVKPPEGEAPPATPGAEGAQAAPDSPAAEAPQRTPPFLARYHYLRPDPALAPLLSAVQKQRLADALFQTPDPKEGDDELVQLVKDYGDARFPGFVLARLHRSEDEAPAGTEIWLRSLAEALGDEQLGELVDTYMVEASYYDSGEEPEAEADDSAAAEAGDGGEGGGAAEAAEEEPADPEVEAARQEAQEAHDAAAIERATRKRSALLKALLSRFDSFVSAGRPAAN